jgi:hypothetical protein
MLSVMVIGVHRVVAFRHIVAAAFLLTGGVLRLMLRHHPGVGIGRGRRLGGGKGRGDQGHHWSLS